ncbi:acyltransferase [Ilyomonas limi]|uniref:Acyltransferase n=2 Tax=Ilyomonas limi TaxID=2575867 RepID=A0A4U3KXY5_9BACT|nr:acyltransferase [Ilyomonas limi]
MTSIITPYWKLKTKILFKLNRVNYSTFKTKGVPYIKIHKAGKIIIGKNFRMNNGFSGNVIGRQQRCIFNVKGKLEIKNNVGVSSLAIVCHKLIEIGNNVLIGGNVAIYDTDFHSLNFEERTAIPEVKTNVMSKEIIIEDNVFIGAHSLILKGVVIGRNSIVGAGSVVTKPIPPNEIWAGNPAKKIRSLTS